MTHTTSQVNIGISFNLNKCDVSTPHLPSLNIIQQMFSVFLRQKKLNVFTLLKVYRTSRLLI